MFSLDTCSYKTCLPMVSFSLARFQQGRIMLLCWPNILPASTLHKLLPKLGVRTRAADSKDLLSVFSLEVLASREEQRSFFIGMMAEQPASAQLVAASVASRACQDSSIQEPRQEAASRDCQDSSLQEHSQEALQSLKASQRTSSRSSFAALMCANIFATVSFVSFKIYSLLLYGMLSFVQLCFETIIVIEQCASRTTCLPRASGTTFMDKSFENNNFIFSFEELVSNKLAKNMAHQKVDTKLACNLLLQLSGECSFEFVS